MQIMVGAEPSYSHITTLNKIGLGLGQTGASCGKAELDQITSNYSHMVVARLTKNPV